jgi:hypothetical protein
MNVEPTGTNATVTGAIRQAARMTGADFQYLLATAQVESNLNPNAQAATSSARGLFQFTEQTWLTTVKELGAPLGYGPYADAISRQPSGDYAVTEPRMASSIMKLRSDPTANALMAGAFTKTNAEKLAVRLGREATEGELYIAHFLGAAGASRLIGLADSSPGTKAAAVFPSAARANPTIFHDARGYARNVGEVYRALVGRYDVARGAPASPPAVVANTGDGPAGRATNFAPDTATLTETYAAAARLSPVAPVADIGPVFHGLFRSNGPEAVAPVISSLWTLPQPSQEAAQAPAAPAKNPAVAKPVVLPAAAPEPMGPPMGSGEMSLFQDTVPDTRALFRGRV